MSQVGGKNSGRFSPSPPPARSIKTRLVSARNVVLGAILAGVLAAVTGWTTGGINWAWTKLTGDSSPVEVATLPAVPETPQVAVTGNGQGTPSPLPDGRLSIGNANFDVAESLGEGHCTLNAVVPRAASQVQPPLIDDGRPDLKSWGSDNNIGDPDITTYSFTVSAKPGRTVTLTRAHTVFVKRPNRSAEGTNVSLHIGAGCGAGGEFRYFATNLDDPTGAWAPRNDDKYRVHEKTNFPYVVKNDDPETFVLTASTANCDCVWRIQLDWVSGTETGHTIIDNAVGRNFHTIGSAGYPRAEWWLDYPTQRWVTRRPTTPPW